MRRSGSVETACLQLYASCTLAARETKKHYARSSRPPTFRCGGPRRAASPLNESFHCPFRARLRTADRLAAADKVGGFFRDDVSLEGVCGGGEGSTSISSPRG